MRCCFLLLWLVAGASAQSIAELATTYNLSTFIQTVGDAGLAGTLSGGLVTVFAPTDEAFAALSNATLELLSNDTALYVDVLLYHFAPGEFRTTDLSDGQNITTFQGSDVTASIDDGIVMINQANVVDADINSSIALIHTIDAVLFPPLVLLT